MDVLIILGSGQLVVGVAEDSVLGVILFFDFGEGVGEKEVIMFLGKVCFGHGSSLFLVVPVDSFLVPVGDEGTCMGGEDTLGMRFAFIVGIQLGFVMA